MFSVRIFRKSVVVGECFFKCCAMELVSERCIVSLLGRVVDVNIYVGLTSSTLSRRLIEHINQFQPNIIR